MDARSIHNFSVALLLSAIGLCPLSAQPLSIRGGRIGFDDNVSTGGDFSVRGVIGQSDSDQTNGGDLTITGGIVASVQWPAPTLTVTHWGNDIIISWPSASVGWTLQQSGDLRAANWLEYSGTVNDDGANRSVIISPPAGKQFYRLKK